MSFARLGSRKKRLASSRSYFVIAAVLLVFGLSANHFYQTRHRDDLSSKELSLLTKPSVNIGKIKVAKDTVSYNAQPATNIKTASVNITNPEDSTGQFPYTASINQKASDGMTFGDSQGDFSFDIIPLGNLSNGLYKSGQTIYAGSDNSRQVLTFKKNGVKEDLLLPKAPGDSFSFSWQLQLGNNLQARLLPNGSVGIYSADPNLFGNIQIEDTKSQALVDKARQNSAKDNLVFVLPQPFIRESDGQTDTTDVTFVLNNNVLTLRATGLKNKTYPLSIDPSVVVTTTADFQTGVDDGMIDYSTANQINRSAISTGSVGTTTQQTSAFTFGREGHSSVVYNGYLYVIGGYGGSYFNDISYCPINSNGSVGACTQQTNAFTTGRLYQSSVAYNGYLYIIGGESPTAQNDIQYCPLNPSTGAVGACTQQTSAFTTARFGQTSVVYNGYLYIVGGSGTGTGCTATYCNDIQYCPINANGSVGTCTQQTSAFTTPRYGHTSVAYNGYLYVIGGYSPTYQNDIQYCPINANGSVGTCTQQTSAFTTPRANHASAAYDGYLYITGGNNGTTNQNDILYCPINANGSVGTCTQQTNAFTNIRSGHTSVAYNGHLYVIGGLGSGTGCAGGYCNDIQYLAINTGTPTFGTLGSFSTANTFPSARQSLTAVANNGYLYIAGGNAASSGGSCTSSHDGGFVCNDVEYATINASGSLGSFASAGTFTNPREGLASAVYNGYFYITGGDSSTSTSPCNATYCNDVQYALICTGANSGVGGCGSTAGTLGTFNSTSSFNTGRTFLAASAYNGYFYIAGGQTTSSGSDCISYDGSAFFDCNAVQYALICTGANSGVGGCGSTAGTLGTFASAATFTTARAGLADAAYNGYFYLAGGVSNTTSTGCPSGTNGDFCKDVLYALICTGANSGVGGCGSTAGTLGTFASAGTMTQDRSYIGGAAYNGYFYVAGGGSNSFSGNCSSAYCGDVIYAAINANGTLGSFASAATFTTARSNLAVAVSNGYLSVAGGTALSAGGNCTGGIPVCDDVQSVRVNSPDQKANYQRIIDVGGSTTIQSIVYNGQAVCGAHLTYATAGSSGVFGGLASIWSMIPGITYTINAASSRYILLNFVLDDSTCGTNSNISDITVNYAAINTSPAAPTLSIPSSGATGVSISPQFQLKTTDAESDYLQYDIALYQSDCSTLVRDINQNSAQTGWTGQNQQTGTAYTGSSTIGSSTTAVHTYQTPALSTSTTYCWKARAIDPGGSNTFGSYSSTQTFTTIPAQPVQINGGVNILGGTTIQ